MPRMAGSAERDLAVGAAAGTGAVRVAGVAAAGRTVVFVVEGTIHGLLLRPRIGRGSGRGDGRRWTC